MKGKLVMAAYRPQAGRDAELIALLRRHLPLLRELGLATERRALVMQSYQDRTIIEIFEWVSDDAVKAAHEHPRVRAYWTEMEALCTYVAPGSLDEMQQAFPHFEPVDALNL